MNLTDFSRLKVLMNKTLSGTDPDILASLRAANAILSKYNLDWVKVLSRSVTVSADGSSVRPLSQASSASDEEIEGLLADLNYIPSRFVASLSECFERTGSLTEAQVNSLREMVRELDVPHSHRRRR